MCFVQSMYTILCVHAPQLTRIHLFENWLPVYKQFHWYYVHITSHYIRQELLWQITILKDYQAYKPAHTLGSITSGQCCEAGVNLANSCKVEKNVPAKKTNKQKNKKNYSCCQKSTFFRQCLVTPNVLTTIKFNPDVSSHLNSSWNIATGNSFRLIRTGTFLL